MGQKLPSKTASVKQNPRLRRGFLVSSIRLRRLADGGEFCSLLSPAPQDEKSGNSAAEGEKAGWFGDGISCSIETVDHHLVSIDICSRRVSKEIAVTILNRVKARLYPQ